MKTQTLLTAAASTCVAIVTLAGGIALAGGWDPEPAQTLGPDLLARATSLDIRGVVPSDDEVLAVDAAGALSEEILEEWLQSDAFTDQVVRHHHSLVWNRINNRNMLQERRLQNRRGVWSNGRAADVTRGQRNLGCSDRPAAVEAGALVTEWEVVDGRFRDEGWVWVEPYWDPGNPIKVCAFDAQQTQISSSGTDCSARNAHRDAECGCGPDLQWCATGAVFNDVITSMERELDQAVREMLHSGAPYESLLTTDQAQVNAPLAHFYRHLAPFATNLHSPVPEADLPEFDGWSAEDWVPVTRGAEHSGILTSPGWLLRHQTNRGRANRFYGAFLCQEFLPQPGGIGGLEGGTPTPDLTVRTGCRDCHARLEPWAAYWGRWAPAGDNYLSADDYPRISEECLDCVRSGNRFCNRSCGGDYLSTPTHPDEEPYLGWFEPYRFLGASHADNPDLGPAAWVGDAVSDGSLAQCTARNVSTWLLGEEAEVPPDTLSEWTSSFEDSGRDYRSLVRTVLQSDVYRRVP